MMGRGAETCVIHVHGWPIALYLQMDSTEAGFGLQWYRATRITRNACASQSELNLPPGVNVREVSPQRRPVDEDEIEADEPLQDPDEQAEVHNG